MHVLFTRNFNYSGIHLMGNYISQGDSESEEEEEEVESRSVTEEYSRIEVEEYSRTADEDTIMPGWDSIDVYVVSFEVIKKEHWR